MFFSFQIKIKQTIIITSILSLALMWKAGERSIKPQDLQFSLHCVNLIENFNAFVSANRFKL